VLLLGPPARGLRLAWGVEAVVVRVGVALARQESLDARVRPLELLEVGGRVFVAAALAGDAALGLAGEAAGAVAAAAAAVAARVMGDDDDLSMAGLRAGDG